MLTPPLCPPYPPLLQKPQATQIRSSLPTPNADAALPGTAPFPPTRSRPCKTQTRGLSSNGPSVGRAWSGWRHRRRVIRIRPRGVVPGGRPGSQLSSPVKRKACDHVTTSRQLLTTATSSGWSGVRSGLRPANHLSRPGRHGPRSPRLQRHGDAGAPGRDRLRTLDRDWIDRWRHAKRARGLAGRFRSGGLS